MATYLTNSNRGEAASHYVGDITRFGRLDVATALDLDDVIKGPNVPEGATILDAKIVCDDLDTNVTPLITLTLRLNNGTTQVDLITDSTVGQDGGVARLDVVAGYQYVVPAAGYWLEVLVSAAPATGATDVDLEFDVTYTMDASD
jgi:hypothetical protein